MSVFGTLSVSLAVTFTFTFHLHHMTIMWPRLHRRAAAEHLQVLGEFRRDGDNRERKELPSRLLHLPGCGREGREGKIDGQGGERGWGRGRRMVLFLVIPRPHSAFQ